MLAAANKKKTEKKHGFCKLVLDHSMKIGILYVQTPIDGKKMYHILKGKENMLFKTYQKITTLFKEHHGYMSFADLRDHQVTVLQLAEMEEEGSLERFARGWYWCKDCGYEKPEDYQYIEIAKVNPRAVICMDSAAWLAGMLKEEPATIAVATARTDRKKMDLENFEIRRFYFQNADVPGEICEKKTEFGSYKYYSPKRTFCDCLRMNNKMPEEVKEEILTWCRKQKYSKEEILEYANKLRAVKNIEEEYQK
mgnify:CR=1 FL=1